MAYRIGDLSKLFHISNEMIRYYEKQGIIRSVRQPNNNYRTYSIWDIFSFLEMLQFRELGISAKNIASMKQEHYSQHLRRYLAEYYEKINREIEYKILCRQRAEELIERTECYEMNENNFWVRKIPKQYLFHLVSSKDDEYEKIQISDEVSAGIFSPQIVNFLDPLVEFGEKQEWWYSISQKYADHLTMPFLSQARVMEEQYCLCTVVNMGEIGEFSDVCMQAACRYAQSKQYMQTGSVTGVILGRGYEQDRFARYLEIRVPIRPLPL